MTEKSARTLYDKIWDAHVVATRDDGTSLIWIDRHLIHEVTAPQAFEGLRIAGRRVHRPDLTLAVADHNVLTRDRLLLNPDEASRTQLATLESNCREFGIEQIATLSAEQGIVHVVGPEQGFTLPGLTLVCGDSHTATHGALGALAFGIGTSEIEHVFASQTLLLRRSRSIEVRIEGVLGTGVSPKDVALAVIGAIGTAGGTGHVIEYTGGVIRAMSVEGRMTICNMAIEAGARAGLVAPDETTFNYLSGRPRAPRGATWDQAISYWQTLPADPGARYDTVIEIDASSIAPLVTWGTSPEDVRPITGRVPDPESFADPAKREAANRSLEYMGLIPDTPLCEIEVQNILIGSCTNARIEDLRAAAAIARGRHVAANVKQALVVPGSGLVRRQAEAERLDRVFIDAGFEWREPGCSMCLSMNADRVPPASAALRLRTATSSGARDPDHAPT